MPDFFTEMGNMNFDLDLKFVNVYVCDSRKAVAVDSGIAVLKF